MEAQEVKPTQDSRENSTISSVIKRNKELAQYDATRIANAIKKAFRAGNTHISEDSLKELLRDIEQKLASTYQNAIHIERIQDAVEEVLMKNNYFQIAKRFIIYRQKHAEERLALTVQKQKKINTISLRKRNLSTSAFDSQKIINTLKRVSKDIDTEQVSLGPIANELEKNIFDGISTGELEDALILSTIAFIEQDPGYDKIAKRLLLQKIYKEVISTTGNKSYKDILRESFAPQIQKGVSLGYFSKELLNFNLEELAEHLNPDLDDELQYLGLRTLYDRYLVSHRGNCIETPQIFWMRVAMGLSINEKDREKYARDFYSLISQLYYLPSTPTLFHSGLARPQLSSCYISTVSDDLANIFKCIGDNAQLAKWSGGIGNDWTPVRATNSLIKSTNVESQGVIPFLKIANDTTLAINRSGKRRGATCAYLETWHLDIEDFIDLRRNTGDDRRRTHDMNIAIWVPDLFMKRVRDEGKWTLFSPSDVPDLHESYGREFEQLYKRYEEKTKIGEIAHFRTVEAVKLWRRILTRLFETGHPWINFKDPCNVRNTQDHAGVIHSSNLCTEITLNSSSTETAVCNLGSINLKKHCGAEGLNQYQLEKTVKTAMRMLDNVIDINFYPTKEAKNSNLKHRPVGLGLMGLQDALFMLGLTFDDPTTMEFVDSTMEHISYNAILASSELAKERGSYASFKGSKWDRGLLPLDTIAVLEEERGESVEVNRNSSLNWTPVREHIRQHGMRNSNTMAIAPTATISNIAGCFPCIEPIYKNVYVKSNMSGEFTILNSYLVQDLKERGLWSGKMIERIKYFDGSIEYIEEIPQEMKRLYKEVFDIDSIALIRLSALRAKWIDQSQSHNIFIKGTSGKKLHDTYFAAWKMGLKTSYYLRTLGATQIEKSTLDAKEYGFTQKRQYTQKPEPGTVGGLIGAVYEGASPPFKRKVNIGDAIGTVGYNYKPDLASDANISLSKEDNGHSSFTETNQGKQRLDSRFDESRERKKTNAGDACSILDPDCEACQ